MKEPVVLDAIGKSLLPHRLRQREAQTHYALRATPTDLHIYFYIYIYKPGGGYREASRVTHESAEDAAPSACLLAERIRRSICSTGLGSGGKARSSPSAYEEKPCMGEVRV